MMLKKYFFLFFLLALQFVQSIQPVQADQRSSAESASFNPSTATGRIRLHAEFWKLIFAKYGEKQSVFHHRKYPFIIYSVLDFTDLSNDFKGKDYEKKRDHALELEEQRILAILKQLGEGKGRESQLGKRIIRLVSKHGLDNPTFYKLAVEPGMIRSQTGIKERFEESLVRSGMYLSYMESAFREEGLPIELTRIPFIESSFDYKAYSSVGAAGIWQFMKKTAKAYMKINNNIDERRDPIISTHAAAKYLKHANKTLGSWPLAITSYNHGVTGVLRASRAVGSSDLNKIIESYDSETFGFASKNFYPEFVAAYEIEKNKEEFFPGLKIEKPILFINHQLVKAATLKELSQKFNVSVDELINYNLSFLAPITKGGAKIPAGYIVKIPKH